MSTLAAARASKSVAVTVIGLMTVLWGCAQAVLGGCLAFGGAELEGNLGTNDPVGGLAPVLLLTAGLMVMIGVVFLFLGVPMMLAGLGVLLRKQWGRILAFVMAVLGILWGLLCLGAYDADAAGNVTVIASGAAEILYGVLAFVILIKHGREFSPPRG